MLGLGSALVGLWLLRGEMVELLCLLSRGVSNSSSVVTDVVSQDVQQDLLEPSDEAPSASILKVVDALPSPQERSLQDVFVIEASSELRRELEPRDEVLADSLYELVPSVGVALTCS